jgi:hypothetical protein
LFDLEYADDTVLLGRSAEVVETFLEFLIYEAAQVGLLLNFDKCEHIAVHTDSPIRIIQNGEVLGNIPKVEVVKYLGVLLSPNSPSTPETNRRLSQARTAFKLLKPFFSHEHLSLKWKLTVYHRILGSILTYAMESLALDKSHLNRLDSFYFKVMRQCLGMKSSFYHRVVADTDKECSNQFIQKTLIDRKYKTLTPSQTIQNRSLKYFGHLLRHQDELPSRTVFTPMGGLRQLSTTNRKGAPRMHWSEIVARKAIRRLDYLNLHNSPPSASSLANPWYSCTTRQDISAVLGDSLFDRLDTTLVSNRLKANAAHNLWKRII